MRQRDHDSRELFQREREEAGEKAMPKVAPNGEDDQESIRR
jgi:hypothetical protein